MLNKLRNRKKKGFTLIEIIVVMVIMVILAAAAIPTILGYVENSRKASYLSNMRAVYTATQTAITEALANGETVSDINSNVDSSTTIKARVAGMTDIAASNLLADTETPDTKGEYAITIVDNKVTKIVACYQNGKTVELNPGEGSNVMDTTSAAG